MSESCAIKSWAAGRLRLAAICTLAAICALLTSCSGGDSKPQKAQAAAGPRAVSVAVAPVVKQDVPVYLSGLG